MTLWGGIGNRSQDLMRQLLAYSAYAELDGGSGSDGDGDGGSGDANGGGNGSGPAAAAQHQQRQQQHQQYQQRQQGVLEQQVSAAAASCRWLMAFARSLKAQLTEDSDLPADLRRILSEEEAALLLAAQSKPSFALAVLTELAAAAPVRESQRIRLDENLTFFTDCCGTCERILRTPIPLSYTRHTSRFMVSRLVGRSGSEGPHSSHPPGLCYGRSAMPPAATCRQLMPPLRPPPGLPPAPARSSGCRRCRWGCGRRAPGARCR